MASYFFMSVIQAFPFTEACLAMAVLCSEVNAVYTLCFLVPVLSIVFWISWNTAALAACTTAYSMSVSLAVG